MKNLDSKKIYFIFIIILIIGSLVYFFFFKNKDISITNEQEISFPTNSVGEIDLSGEFLKINVDGENTDLDSLKAEVPFIRKISSQPIVGAYLFNLKDIEEIFIRYIEKSSGHIYETSTNTLTIDRISNTTIPGLFKTYWLDQDNFVMQYIDTDKIKSYLAYLKNNQDGLKTLEGKYLVDDIKDLFFLNKKIFYTTENENSLIGIITDLNGEDAKYTFESPLKEWLISKITDTKLAFNSKTSENTLGYLFVFDLNNGEFKKYLGDKVNLSSLMNSNSDILYSENYRSQFKLSVYNNVSKTSTEMTLKTLPEKCLWAKDKIKIFCAIPNNYINPNDLDNWYKGKIFFNDSLWLIDTKTNEAKKIIDLENVTGEKIDIIDIKIDEKEKYLIFTNKINFDLWTLKIPEIL
ncbi:MAG: hypothetical protein V1851_03100 [Patescibacteria group bacterium]